MAPMVVLCHFNVVINVWLLYHTYTKSCQIRLESLESVEYPTTEVANVWSSFSLVTRGHKTGIQPRCFYNTHLSNFNTQKGAWEVARITGLRSCTWAHRSLDQPLISEYIILYHVISSVISYALSYALSYVLSDSIMCCINIICYFICYISYIMLYQMHMLYHVLYHIQRLDLHKHLAIISGPFLSAVDPGLTELHTPLGLSGCGTGRDKENRWGKLEIGGKCLCKYTILETLLDLFWGY